MLFATLVEVCCSRNLAKDYYKIEGVEAIKPDDDSEDIEAVQRKMREDALRGIMEAMQDGEHGVFTEHQEDDMLDTEMMRLNGAAPDASDIENADGSRREIHPMVKHLNFDDPEFIPQDNCYAEAKPANPNSKQQNKDFKDSGTQSFASSNPEFNMLRGGASHYGDMSAAEKRRQKGKLGRGREIKKQIENKIKEENRYMEDQFDQDDDLDLQVIAEAE